MASTEQKIDPFKMFCHATMYWKSAASLGRESNPVPYELPWVIFQVLSLEIYFKCLLRIHGKPIPYWHELQDLFNKFDGTDQEAFRKAFQVRADLNADTIGVTLQDVLGRSKGVFKDGKYGYDFDWQSGLNRGFKEATYAIRDVIDGYKPDFDEECRVKFHVEAPT